MSGAQLTADLRLGHHRDLRIEPDVTMFDAPYSKRTHTGHDAANEHAAAAGMFPNKIDYQFWTETEIAEAVALWSDRTRSWFVTLTDHVLAPIWSDHLSEAGRYVFAPLPFLDMGKGPRVLGDGPASWTVQIVVARPRKKEFMSWGSLPGGYLRSKGDVVWRAPSGKKIQGGKPIGLMRALVRDYSRHGDLICDITAGHATTLLAALTEGRRAAGAEVDPEAYELAQARLARGYTPSLLAPVRESPAEQVGLPMVESFELNTHHPRQGQP